MLSRNSTCLVMATLLVVGCGGKSHQSVVMRSPDVANGAASADTATPVEPEVDLNLKWAWQEFQSLAKEQGLEKHPLRANSLVAIKNEPPLKPDGTPEKAVLGRCNTNKLFSGETFIRYVQDIQIHPGLDAILKTGGDEDLQHKIHLFIFLHEVAHCLGGVKHISSPTQRGYLPISIMDAMIPSKKEINAVPWSELIANYRSLYNAAITEWSESRLHGAAPIALPPVVALDAKGSLSVKALLGGVAASDSDDEEAPVIATIPLGHDQLTLAGSREGVSADQRISVNRIAAKDLPRDLADLVAANRLASAIYRVRGLEGSWKARFYLELTATPKASETLFWSFRDDNGRLMRHEMVRGEKGAMVITDRDGYIMLNIAPEKLDLGFRPTVEDDWTAPSEPPRETVAKKVEPITQDDDDAAPTESPSPSTSPEPTVPPSPSPSTSPEPTMMPEPSMSPEPEPEPTMMPEPSMSPEPEPEPTMMPEPSMSPEPEPEVTVMPEPMPSMAPGG